MPDIYDQRTIVDLRFFGYVKPNVDNRVEFASDNVNANGSVEPGIKDMYGMPQVSETISYSLNQVLITFQAYILLQALGRGC